MKKWVQRVACFMLLITLWAGWFTLTVKASSYVQTSGTHFVLNNHPFYFAGTNNYYFHYKSKKMVDAVFDDMKAMDLKVIRIWGFHDGTPQENSVLQSRP